MKRQVKLFILVVPIILCLVPVISLQAGTTAEFVLKNDTSFWITLYVDGSRSCSAPPGDRCVDLVSTGKHTFKAAETKKPSNYIRRTINVPVEGFTWTIYEP